MHRPERAGPAQLPRRWCRGPSLSTTRRSVTTAGKFGATDSAVAPAVKPGRAREVEVHVDVALCCGLERVHDEDFDIEVGIRVEVAGPLRPRRTCRLLAGVNSFAAVSMVFGVCGIMSALAPIEG